MNIRIKLHAAFHSTRPSSSALAGILPCLVFWIHDGFSRRSIYAALAMCSVTMFGFVVNDIMDVEKDRMANVQRPIARDAISIGQAWVLAAVLLTIVAALSASEVSGGKLLAETAFALLLYTPIVRLFPSFKAPYVAAMSLVPLYYPTLMLHIHYAWSSYAALTVFIVGRENFMDADEYEGDRKAKTRTLAVVLGQRAARRTGTVMMLAAMLWLVFLPARPTGTLAAVMALLALILCMSWPNMSDSYRIQYTRIAMLLAAIAIAES
jgi:geranylgeranylglycerol-phosphate geranylgeranyltransferase